MSVMYEFFSKSGTKHLEFFTLRYEKLTKIYLNFWEKRNKLSEILSKPDDYFEITEIMHQLNFN